MRSATALLLALLTLQFGAPSLDLFRCSYTGAISLSCCCDDARSPPGIGADCCDAIHVDLLHPDLVPSRAMPAPPVAAIAIARADRDEPASPAARRIFAPAPHPRPPPSVARYLELRTILI